MELYIRRLEPLGREHGKRGADRRNFTDRMLLASLHEYGQRRGLEPARLKGVRVARTEHGRPWFCMPDGSDCGIFCSVSHSGRFWIGALERRNLGIDIEDPPVDSGGARRKTRNFNGIAQRFFQEEEAEYVREHGEDGFYRLWVRKEAVLKYRGIGLSMGMDGFSVLEQRQEEQPLWIENLELPQLPGAFAAVCAEKQCELEGVFFISLNAR